MKSDRRFYISALPALGELGLTPPVTPGWLLEHVAALPGARALVESVLLFDDLVQREAFLAGELRAVEPAVLTPAQARNEAPLPPHLATVAESGSLVSRVDGLWEAAFRHAHRVARKCGSVFLNRWVGFEVALRNALAAARAKRLGLDEVGFRVAADLGDSQADLETVLNEWSAAATPLDGLRVLIRARWNWLPAHEAWYTFQDDDLAAFAAKLALMQQWKRVVDAEERGFTGTSADESSLSLERATG